MPGLLFSLLPPGARDPVSTGSGNQDTDNDYDDDDNDDFQVIGSLEQQWSFCQPRFLVKDERGEAILSIEGPGIVCDCCSDIDFNILSLVNESEIGKITKQWSGIGREMFTDAQNFGVTFPIDLDVKTKATLLGATFLIDFMYFEKQSNG